MVDHGYRTVSVDEFEEGLKAAGVPIDHEDLQEMFKQADIDNSGTMDFYEFRTAYNHYGYDYMKHTSR